MSDIVERLRNTITGSDGARQTLNEAADEIERLRASLYVETVESAGLIARLAEAVEVVRSCRATYVENDDASALERIIDRIDTFLAKMEGR